MKEIANIVLEALNANKSANEIINITKFNETDIDWEAVLEFSYDHSLHCLVFDYYNSKWSEAFKSGKLYKDWKITFFQTVFEQVTYYNKAKSILKSLVDNHIDYIIIKGTTVQELYPNPKVRLMGDIDIFIEEKNLSQVEDIFKSFDYEVKLRSEKEVSFSKKNAYIFEVHHKLFKSTQYKNVKWFDDVCRKKCIPYDEYHCYQLAPDENLTYLITHAAKHLLSQGVGLRQLYDVKLFIENYYDAIDFELVEEYLKRFNCLKAGMYIIELCRRYLGLSYEQKYCINEEQLEKLYNKVLISGVFGQTNDSVLDYINTKDLRHRGKDSNFSKLKVIFPSMSMMKESYPILRKVVVLLPIIWLYRALTVTFTQKKLVVDFIINNTSKNQAETSIALSAFLKDEKIEQL